MSATAAEVPGGMASARDHVEPSCGSLAARYVGVRGAEDAGHQGAHVGGCPGRERKRLQRAVFRALDQQDVQEPCGPGLAQAVELGHHLT